MSRPSLLCCVVLLVGSFVTSVSGCAAPSDDSEDTPAAGAEDNFTASERSAVMDALRAKVRPELKNQDIVFDVSQGHFAAKDGYAFLTGQIKIKGTNKPVDYRGTEYQKDIDEGIFDDHIDALLKKEGGRWVVKAHAIGSTDVAWWGWWDTFGAPRNLFPGEQQEDAALADRRAVMDSLRAVIRPTLKDQEIVFNVRDGGAYKAEGAFVFLRGKIQRKDGKAVDYTGTTYEADIRDGLFDDGFAALLKKESGKWQVKAHVIGSTGVDWEGWAQQYGAPAGIFR